MQSELFHVTAPHSPFFRAPNGQPVTQAGSRQCIHCLLTKAKSVPPGSLQSLMMFLVFELRSAGMSQRPEASDVSSSTPAAVSGGKPLASLQAVIQARQPVQMVLS